MSLHPIKPIKIGRKNRMKITLKNVMVRLYESTVLVRGDAFVKRYKDLDREAFKKWVDEVDDNIKKEQQPFSEIMEVIRVMQNAKYRRNDDGNPIKNPQSGEFEQIPWAIEDQRKNGVIIKAINVEIAKLDKKDLDFRDPEEVQKIVIDLLPKYAEHLAQLVQDRCSTYYATGLHIVDFCDRFIDYEEEARVARKKGVANDENDDKKSDKKTDK